MASISRHRDRQHSTLSTDSYSAKENMLALEKRPMPYAFRCRDKDLDRVQPYAHFGGRGTKLKMKYMYFRIRDRRYIHRRRHDVWNQPWFQIFNRRCITWMRRQRRKTTSISWRLKVAYDTYSPWNFSFAFCLGAAWVLICVHAFSNSPDRYLKCVCSLINIYLHTPCPSAVCKALHSPVL